MEIKRALQQAMKERGYKVPAISKILNIPADRIYKWYQQGTNPKEEDALKVWNWINGESVNRGTLSAVEEEQESYLAKRLEIKNGSKHPIPVYGGYTTLGNIEIIDDENIKHRVVAELPADVFLGCDHAEKAKGDSMYPLIMNQALLVGRTCTVKGISFGEKYIIKTKDGLDTTKFVHPGKSPDSIILKAYNKSIPEQEIDIKDIIFCCRIFWIVNPT